MNLKTAFSSCPNDTYIFDAMIHQKVDTEGLNFKFLIDDIENLNKLAMHDEIDIVKLSYHAFAYVSENFQILDAGSALGFGNGPLLVSKRKIYPDEMKDAKIAIPGKYTTANLLLGIAFPEAKKKHEYLFSDIEEVVLSNEVDAGLIIHESRFTYEKKGLKKIIDLGEFWENETKLPIPLGCIAVRRNLENNTKLKIERVLKKSIEFAKNNPQSSFDFVKKYAQEIDNNVISKHIDLYANDFTFSLKKEGKKAIETLFEKATKLKLIPEIKEKLFLDNQ
ncbi:MAG: 1,4-dihydroxy-6-naphthoate synthase [Bacteroidetes bacterium]|jgi:1,4-dihydroxy-6-naphthoate synthase|nr:1,4-dihydroxy-6-naphthoate synthase [Bacteroidota bacterium]MBT6687242.1 1,4-dihydroxy-6-naphthoate synthase [Bacteroidota bacterium]MBT7144015.1 1,4-dihydroxy-6-naphthoate synthase [Bacteroidota bacterium]MBT7493174.1 1,4-dihydroxy-6-naphthoate synthase [Bacteroidota bacterium]